MMNDETLLPQVTQAQAYAGIDVEELATVTARMTELLNQEVKLLEAMRITEAGSLQHEKLALTQVLEAQKKYIASQPEVMDELSTQDREFLGGVAREFNEALQRNVRLVAVAKAVNQRVVQAMYITPSDITFKWSRGDFSLGCWENMCAPNKGGTLSHECSRVSP